MAIDSKKYISSHEPRTFVAITERVISNDTCSVSCGQIEEAGLAIREQLNRLIQGGIQHTTAPDTTSPSETGEQRIMNGQNHFST